MATRKPTESEEFPLRVAAASWVGLARPDNEDAASANGERVGTLFEKRYTHRRHVLLVADGMGGHVGGAIASDLVVGYLVARARSLVDAQSSAELVNAANRALYEAVDRNLDLCGMGTTIAGVVATAAEILWFNVGDSRIYLLSGSGLRRLSVDHAIGSALTQCLGGSFYPTEVSPACGVLPWAAGDRVLICSDGLTDLLGDAELEQELLAEEDDARAVKALLRQSSARGAPDNVTLVLATNDAVAPGQT